MEDSWFGEDTDLFDAPDPGHADTVPEDPGFVDAGDLATLSQFVGGRYGSAAGETIAAQASNDAPAALQALAALVNG